MYCAWRNHRIVILQVETLSTAFSCIKCTCFFLKCWYSLWSTSFWSPSTAYISIINVTEVTQRTDVANLIWNSKETGDINYTLQLFKFLHVHGDLLWAAFMYCFYTCLSGLWVLPRWQWITTSTTKKYTNLIKGYPIIFILIKPSRSCTQMSLSSGQKGEDGVNRKLTSKPEIGVSLVKSNSILIIQYRNW